VLPLNIKYEEKWDYLSCWPRGVEFREPWRIFGMDVLRTAPWTAKLQLASWFPGETRTQAGPIFHFLDSHLTLGCYPALDRVKSVTDVKQK